MRRHDLNNILTNLTIFDKFHKIFWQIWQFLTNETIFDKCDNFWQSWQFLTNLTIFDKFDNFWQIWQIFNFCLILKMLTTFKTILETCNIWDTDYNSDNWELEFMIIIVSWQLRVTGDSICNSCNVYIQQLIWSLIDVFPTVLKGHMWVRWNSQSQRQNVTMMTGFQCSKFTIFRIFNFRIFIFHNVVMMTGFQC